MDPLDWFRDEGNRRGLFDALKWIGGILGAAALARFLKVSRQMRAGYLDRYRNLSKAESSGEARRYFGPRIVAVIPFRMIGVAEQFIAVLYREHKSRNPVYRVDNRLALLKGRNGNYEVIDTQVRQMGVGEHPPEYFGMVDIRRNGGRDLYVVSYSAGSGAASFDVVVFDPEDGRKYQVIWSYIYHVAPPQICFNGDFSERPEVRTWLREKAQQLVDRERLLPKTTEERVFREAENEWVMRHGLGCTTGPLSIVRKMGYPPRMSEPTFSVDDGRYIWISSFKGSLAVYDKQTSEYFIAFVGLSQYHWISQIIVGERYAWLQSHSGFGGQRGILTIDRLTWELKIVPVRESRYMRRVDADLFLSSGLNVWRKRLCVGRTKLTSPKWVNPRTEFQRAVAADCEPTITIG